LFSALKEIRSTSLAMTSGTPDETAVTVVGTVVVVVVLVSVAVNGLVPLPPHAPTTNAKAQTLVNLFILPNLFWVSK
jgi:hypothetical protein